MKMGSDYSVWIIRTVGKDNKRPTGFSVSSVSARAACVTAFAAFKLCLLAGPWVYDNLEEGEGNAWQSLELSLFAAVTKVLDFVSCLYTRGVMLPCKAIFATLFAAARD